MRHCVECHKLIPMPQRSDTVDNGAFISNWARYMKRKYCNVDCRAAYDQRIANMYSKCKYCNGRTRKSSKYTACSSCARIKRLKLFKDARSPEGSA